MHRTSYTTIVQVKIYDKLHLFIAFFYGCDKMDAAASRIISGCSREAFPKRRQEERKGI